jgi:hypothetical protein
VCAAADFICGVAEKVSPSGAVLSKLLFNLMGGKSAGCPGCVLYGRRQHTEGSTLPYCRKRRFEGGLMQRICCGSNM